MAANWDAQKIVPACHDRGRHSIDRPNEAMAGQPQKVTSRREVEI